MKKMLLMLIPIYLLINSMGISAKASGSDEVFLLKHDGKNNYMEFFVESGHKGTIEFELCNISGETKSNHVLVYDSKTAVNGGNIVMTPDNFSNGETAAWFDTNYMEMVLEPGQCKSCSLLYKIPDDIPDGVYTAILALYAYANDTALDGEDVTLKIDSNYTSTIAVILRVGEEARAEFCLGDGMEFITESSTGNSYMLIPIENIGSAYGFPIVEYSIFDAKGAELQTGSLKLDIFYRNTSSEAAVFLENGIPTTGSYTADVRVLDSGGSNIQDFAVYAFEVDDKTMKEVIRSRIENHNENDSAWQSDFIVLRKQELILGSAGILGVVCLFVVLATFLKGRNRN